MPNNFRLTGSVYVSKAGNDTNDGLTPETPKLTIGAGLAVMTAGQTLIVGTGVYKESLTPSNIVRTITADGRVKLSGGQVLSISIGGTTTFNNIIFEDYIAINQTSAIITYNNCRIIRSTISGSFPFTLNRSILINCPITNTSTNFAAYNSIFIDSSLTNGAILIASCYANSNCTLRLRLVANVNINNNVQGLLRGNGATNITTAVVQDTSGAYYDLSIAGTGGSGTQENPYYRGNTASATAIFDYTNFRIAYSNVLGATNISTNPLFNDITRYDFTLKANSPHIGAGIGGTNYAVTNYPVSDLEVVSGDTNTDNYVFQPFTTPLTIGVFNMYGLLEFNKSQAGGSDENKNVPDFDVFTSGDTTGSNSPDRLTYEMRWTTSTTQPTLSTDWDNGGLLPVGSYGVFQWFEQPYVDASGVSSGLYNYNSATRNSIAAVWLDVRVTVRNNYTN